MYLDDGELVLSPTDLTKFLACRHLTSLDLAVAQRRLEFTHPPPDAALELLFAKGLDHEHDYLEALRRTHDVVDIDTSDLAAAVLATERAMAAGAEVIYQATFLHGGRRGHADFLLRTDDASALGAWSYDVADTKLARRLKVPALLQMADYGEHLRRIQGRPPHLLTVVAGDGALHRFRFADVEAYARRLGHRFSAFLADGIDTVAEPVAHCGQCRWEPRCAAEWRAADHLSLVAFMRGDHARALEAAGIRTVAALARAPFDALPTSIGRASRERLQHQARLQLAERETGQPVYELIRPVEPGLGLLRLPEPDPADLYLDFEGDPWAGREYLAGVGDRTGAFTAFWAHSADGERRLVEELIDELMRRWQADPGLHVYHYAPYERAALQRMTSRHGTREAELDILLRAEVLVDLYAVVRQGVRISKESYSIKKLEAFYWGRTRAATADVSDAMDSVVAYERWLVEPDQSILDQIERYNREDVESTLALHDWLELRRAELGPDLGRPQPEEVTASEPGADEQAETELAGRLLDAGRPLLAGLVGWHRREARPGWWEVFARQEFDDDELVEDGAVVGPLAAPEYVQDVKQSSVWEYRFPPQLTSLRPGVKPIDVTDQKAVGEIVAIDAEAGWVQVKRSKKLEPKPSRGFGPPPPILDRVLRVSIAESAERILAGQDILAGRLLSGTVPASVLVRADETPAQAVVRIGSALDGAVLAVQGPPGTGKSTAGAELIRTLLDAGLRVGITALSHAVIGNLLTKVGRPSLQRSDESQWCGHQLVECVATNDAVAARLASGQHRLVGGTAWLWSHDSLRDSVDVLIVDEAGQFSLANTVAVSRAARSLVLLGDPQQLAQPSQADHPYGAGVSALEHWLRGHDTVPPDRGVFLDTTWRMHPEITSFVSQLSYEDRLLADKSLAQQAVLGSGPLSGSGLRWVPVEHAGCESESPLEAAVVADLVSGLLGRPWVSHTGVVAPLTADDILVVTPYNAHMALLRAAGVPDGVQVGTVDRFQGREAAVVIYSLASSSAADAPRGVDFLFDTHRLNVAVSRARALTVLVGSPALLDAEVHNPVQLRMVNALCRYVEAASAVQPSIAGAPTSAHAGRQLSRVHDVQALRRAGQRHVEVVDPLP